LASPPPSPQYIKAGFSGDNLPRYTFPSVVGRPTLRAEEEVLGDVPVGDLMVGEEALSLRHALELTYPLDSGVVRSWEDMEHVWSHLFYTKMGMTPSDLGARRVLLTEAPMNPREARKRMVEVMFEKYGFGGMQVAIQATLSLYAQGLLTGLVLDSGDGVTHVVAVADGFVPVNLTRRLDVAGRHITRYLTKLLLLRGYAFNRTADFQTVAEIKEKSCYVAPEPAKERRLAQDTTVLMEKYTLPDGRVIRIGRERFEAPEALFTPSLVDVESPGMSDLVFDVIQRADMDLRPALYKSVVLSGGTTMFPGLSSRLEADLKERHLTYVLKGDKTRVGKVKIAVVDPP
jgi:actin-related protein 2